MFDGVVELGISGRALNVDFTNDAWVNFSTSIGSGLVDLSGREPNTKMLALVLASF